MIRGSHLNSREQEALKKTYQEQHQTQQNLSTGPTMKAT